jgi:hypothetical protein
VVLADDRAAVSCVLGEPGASHGQRRLSQIA